MSSNPSSLYNLLEDPGPLIYYDDGFMAVIEDHLSLLQTSITTTTQAIPTQIGNKWDGDLFGLLSEMGSPPFMNWTIMRMNGMRSQWEFDFSQLQILLIPSISQLAALIGLYRTTGTIVQ